MSVIGQDSAGAPVDTTVYHWTPADTFGINLVAVHWGSPTDTAPPHYVFAATALLIPATSPGWDLSFTDTFDASTGLPYTPHLKADRACTAVTP